MILNKISDRAIKLRYGLLVACVVLTCAAFARKLGGALSYNVYALRLVTYLRDDRTDGEPLAFSEPYRWLRRAADLGDRRAGQQVAYLTQHVGTGLPEGDSLSLELAIRGWHSQRLGYQVPASVWELLRTGSARIEAEEMMIAGAATPNPYAVVKMEADRTFVILYWHHNHLRTLVAVPKAGWYKVTVNARDWPPSPLRLRVCIGEQSNLIVWERGDYTWREETAEFQLLAGVREISIHFVGQAGDDPAQDACIDWLALERLD